MIFDGGSYLATEAQPGHMASHASSTLSTPAHSRPSTSGSACSRERAASRRVRPPEPVLPRHEVQRRNRSLFSATKVSHAEALQLAAEPIGETLTVKSLCAFTANRKAGVPVAVVLDCEKEHSVRAMTRIAERCIEYSVVVVQPYGMTGSRGTSRGSGQSSRGQVQQQQQQQELASPERPGTMGSKGSSRGSYVAKLFLLTPGGPSSRTMSTSMLLGGISALIEHPQVQFAQLQEGLLYAVKICSPVGKEQWDETVDVRIGDDGAIWVKVPNPKIERHVEPEDVCEALNINLLSLQMDMPVQVVSSIARHILVPVRSRRQMHDLDPYWDLVSDVCRKYDAEGFHLFSLDPMAGGAVHTRNLSPLVRLEEEAASPSANAALTGYIHFHRILPIDSEERFTCEQGWAFGMKQRPSKIYVQLELQQADTHLEAIDITAQGVTEQNMRAGSAVGAHTTKERLMAQGDRYTSNYMDQTRFNLPEDAFPLKWRDAGMSRPATGIEIKIQELGAALEAKSRLAQAGKDKISLSDLSLESKMLTFSQQEFDALGVAELPRGSFILVGERYYIAAQGYYEEQMARELELKMEQERFKRAGKEWKETKAPHVSTAFVPPPIALPAVIVGCWVGGTVVPSAPNTEYPIDY